MIRSLPGGVSHPFNNGRLPLDCSGNPGFICRRAKRVRISPVWSVSNQMHVVQLTPSDPLELRRLFAGDAAATPFAAAGWPFAGEAAVDRFAGEDCPCTQTTEQVSPGRKAQGLSHGLGHVATESN